MHYSTAFRLAGQYMVERNWRIVIVLLISVSGKTWGAGCSVCGYGRRLIPLPDDSQRRTIGAFSL